jgi:hypothetical protein
LAFEIESLGNSWRNAAVFSEKKSMGGTCSQRMIASASALMSAGLSWKVPVAAVTSTIGMVDGSSSCNSSTS